MKFTSNKGPPRRDSLILFDQAMDSCHMDLTEDAVHRRNECDCDKSNHQTDKENDGRFKQTCEVLQLVLKFPVKVRRGCSKLLVERPRALSNDEHVPRCGGKETRGGQRSCKPLASQHRFAGIEKPTSKDGVGGSIAGDLKCVRNGHSGINHGAQDSTESLEDRRRDQVTNNRCSE